MVRSSTQRNYRQLLQQKCEAFWKAKVDAERSSPRQLWHSIDVLLGRGRVPLSADVDAAELHRFFDENFGPDSGPQV